MGEEDRKVEIVRLFTQRVDSTGSPASPQPPLPYWIGVYSLTVAYRLLSKLKLSPYGCLEYQGYRNPRGYGNFKIDKVTHYPHRVMMAFIAGRLLASDEIVMHLCDNPCCCHPMHLKLGTLQTNVADMDAKGRRSTRKGRKRRKNMSVADVVRIKLALWGSHSVLSIAVRMGYGETTIRNIRDGHTWRKIELPKKEDHSYDPFADE